LDEKEIARERERGAKRKAKAGNGCYLDGKEIEREREREEGGAKQEQEIK
jgi:hypothetical protein